MRPGHVLVSHLPYSQDLEALLSEEGIPSLLMIRDPRDIILSHCKHLVQNEGHRLHERYVSLPDVESRLSLTIRGDSEGEIDPIRLRFEYFLGWLETDTLIVRFEDLIGPRGGGTREAQVRALAKVCDHIGIETDDARVRDLASRLFYTASPTFRKGLVGQWKDKMSHSIKELVDEKLGDLIRRYGYEFPSTEALNDEAGHSSGTVAEVNDD